MKSFILIALTLLMLISATAIFSQSPEITKDEYYGPWRAAFQKARGLNRRHVSKTEVVKDGKVAETDEWLYEYDLPDKIRMFTPIT